MTDGGSAAEESRLIEQLEELQPQLTDGASEIVAAFCDAIAADGFQATKRGLSLVPALRRLRERSEHALDHALSALATGHGGNLVLQLPVKVGGNTEIHYALGDLHLLLPKAA